MEERRFRIIVVDDDEETVETLSSMAELTGHEVASYTDPYKALQSFMKTPADLVITDLNMPHIDGFEMIKRMKERRKTTEFIVATGEKNLKTVFQARGLGVTFLFFKPVPLADLEIAIDKIYDRALYWVEKLKEAGGKGEIILLIKKFSKILNRTA